MKNAFFHRSIIGCIVIFSELNSCYSVPYACSYLPSFPAIPFARSNVMPLKMPVPFNFRQGFKKPPSSLYPCPPLPIAVEKRWTPKEKALKSKLTPKILTKKRLLIALAVAATVFSIGALGVFYWKRSQKKQPFLPVPVSSLPLKPTPIITGQRSLEEKVRKYLSKDRAQFKIDGGHSHDHYIETLEKDPYLFNVRDLTIERTGNIQRVHAPEGKFEEFTDPGVVTKKEQQTLSWQDFSKICTLPGLGNVEKLTLKGFVFAPSPQPLGRLAQFNESLEILKNRAALSQGFKKLQDLRLEDCLIDQDFADVLKNHSLKTLEFVGSPTSPHSMHILLKETEHTPLTSLAITNSHLDNKNAALIMQSAACAHVKTLDFSGNDLSLDFLIRNPHPFTSPLKMFSTPSYSPYLENLTVANNPLVEDRRDFSTLNKDLNRADRYSVFTHLKDNAKTVVHLGSVSKNSNAIFLKRLFKERLQYSVL